MKKETKEAPTNKNALIALRQSTGLCGCIGILILLLLTGCTETKPIIRVGFCQGPYDEFFSLTIAPSMEKQGYTLEYYFYDTYEDVNFALRSKAIDLNLFQSKAYLEQFCRQYDARLSALNAVPTIGMGIYSTRYDSLDKLPENATVAIPSDTINRTRAISMLAQAELITLDKRADPLYATQYTLAENPLALQFFELEAHTIAGNMSSFDLVALNGNYAYTHGYAAHDALFQEEMIPEYLAVFAIRSEDRQEPFAEALCAIMESEVYHTILQNNAREFSTYHMPE